MMPASANLHWDARSLVVSLGGDWHIDQALPRFEPTSERHVASDASRADGDTAPRIGFDSTALGTWDSSLLIFLRQCEAYSEAEGYELDTSNLPERITTLLALARAVPERELEEEPAPPGLLARIGTAGVSAWDSAHSTLSFVGEVVQGFGRLATGRVRMQWRAFWVVVQSNSSGALPIVTLIALLVGIIIAFLGVVVLQRFGAGYYVSYLVGYGMLREMGALMTGIIIAGRTGAGFAAEIGSMKVTEELDAYATLGISAVDHLVLPRVLGLFVMMPLLVLYADIVGILGGLGVAVALLDLTTTQFFGGMLAAVSLSDALLGIFKATVFGVIIGLAGCMHGLRTGSDASAVGRAATSAVVLGITLIVVANALLDWLAALWQI
jgi:phospholipid/cholesterol/gamma-HCH transport system permease protein